MTTVRSPKTDEEWKAYYELRFDVLRRPWNQPEGSERLPDDLEQETVLHAAAFAGQTGEIVGCARLHPTNEYYADRTVGRVRVVAVKPSHQGKGIGRALMTYLESQAINSGLNEIILEAREDAIEFYKAIGYRVIEKSFLLYGIVQHWTMQKRIC
ncbi:putative acetyltransferase [Halotydeus destructor]|nr:putative acetyltransferase [Halotydeus destructor]